MADESVVRTDFYVYILFLEDGVTPFYVGKGRGQRWLIHERDAFKGTYRKDEVLRRMLRSGITEIPKLKIATNLTDPQAKAIEIFLIAAIGRMPHGLLANHTSGGDGIEDRSPEVRAKTSARNVSSWQNPKVRQRRIDGMKAAWTPEKRAEHSAKWFAMLASGERKIPTPSAEICKRISEAAKKSWQKPDRRAKGLAALQEVDSRPGYKEKLKARPVRKITDAIRDRSREVMKARWADPEERAKMLELLHSETAMPKRAAKLSLANRTPEARQRMTKLHTDPDIVARRLAAQRATWSSPEDKARRSAASKAMWAKKKAVSSQ
jgi:hypothetical protein